MSARRAWRLFAAGCLAVIGGVAWLSTGLVQAERASARADAEARRGAAIQLARERMEAWLGPLLAREAARPADHYAPFLSPNAVFAKDLEPLEGEPVLVPSPLLLGPPDVVELHFQWSAEAGFASPQVPAPGLEIPALLAGGERADFDARAEALAQIAERVDPARLLAELPAAPAGGDVRAGEQPAVRREVSSEDCVVEGEQPVGLSMGPMVPMILGDALLVVRRVDTLRRRRLQGFALRWPMLRARLTASMGDALPGAALALGEHPQAPQVAGLPVSLVAPPLDPSTASPPDWAGLVAIWIAAAAALGAVGVALWASVRLADRRARFVAAVTHELRTPLTTIRMYSQMLADGMVPEGRRRTEYLQTLEAEAERLEGLVDDVLAYARLERAGGGGRSESLRLGELCERVVGPLRRRAERAAVPFEVRCAPSERPLRVDPAAVEHILLNLVDNACKYGAGSPVALDLRIVEEVLVAEVADAGPGLPARGAARIFEPFQRARPAGDATPGVGLGLALARELARALDGDLVAAAAQRGARFVLTVPVG